MPELTVIVPTFNERENVEILVRRVAAALDGVDWEIVFVDDDSPDSTWQRLREMAQNNRRVRLLQRIGRRGLASAVIEGALSSSAPLIAVMDADLQHDEALLPRMLDEIKAGGLDIVIGSRFVEGARVGNLACLRLKMSELANRLGRLVIHAELTDPMSGFFMMRRLSFDRSVHRLSGMGFKILLDLFASSREPLRFRELPYSFRQRTRGSSKFDSFVMWEYLTLLADKAIGNIIPIRFLLFSLVGAFGIFVHLSTLGGALHIAGLEFTAAQVLATVAAMTSNFFLNNVLTYRDQRLHGIEMLWGLISFYLICSVGVIGNVGIANLIYERHESWWLAGGAGALIGVVWNFAASSIFTWHRTHR
jgi:dolichol-phosphate mannosyltransferase